MSNKFKKNKKETEFISINHYYEEDDKFSKY